MSSSNDSKKRKLCEISGSEETVVPNPKRIKLNNHKENSSEKIMMENTDDTKDNQKENQNNSNNASLNENKDVNTDKVLEQTVGYFFFFYIFFVGYFILKFCFFRFIETRKYKQTFTTHPKLCR